MAIRVLTAEAAEGAGRTVDARAGNDRVAEKAKRLQFVSRVPLLCECSAPGCRSVMLIDLADYYEIRHHPNNFITAPGHEIEGAQPQRKGPDYTIRRAS